MGWKDLNICNGMEYNKIQ